MVVAGGGGLSRPFPLYFPKYSRRFSSSAFFYRYFCTLPFSKQKESQQPPCPPHSPDQSVRARPHSKLIKNQHPILKARKQKGKKNVAGRYTTGDSLVVSPTPNYGSFPIKGLISGWLGADGTGRDGKHHHALFWFVSYVSGVCGDVCVLSLRLYSEISLSFFGSLFWGVFSLWFFFSVFSFLGGVWMKDWRRKGRKRKGRVGCTFHTF